MRSPALVNFGKLKNSKNCLLEYECQSRRCIERSETQDEGIVRQLAGELNLFSSPMKRRAWKSERAPFLAAKGVHPPPTQEFDSGQVA